MVGVHESSTLGPEVRRAIANAIKQALAVGAQPGDVKITVSATADTGWLMLDGSTVTNGQTLEPALWGRIPASWKSGADILLPDARGRTIIGAGTGAGLTARTLGATVGVESVTLTAAESGLPAHNHTQNAHHHDVPGLFNVPAGGSATALVANATGAYGTSDTTATNIANTATNASAAHTNMQPSLALNFVIKT